MLKPSIQCMALCVSLFLAGNALKKFETAPLGK